jgi:hypothetical protein
MPLIFEYLFYEFVLKYYEFSYYFRKKCFSSSFRMSPFNKFHFLIISILFLRKHRVMRLIFYTKQHYYFDY